MNSPRGFHWWAGATALAAFIVRLHPGPWSVDDAFITFRYARNLVDGVGLVYNAGEAVLGTTTPLFALLLSGLSFVTGAELPHIALVTSAVADAVGTILLVVLGRQLGLSRAASILCSACWALYPLSVRYAVGGMETSITAALLLAVFVAFLTQREILTALLLGLAILARPDSLAAAGVLVTWTFVQRRSIPARAILVMAAVLLPWILFATIEYGSPLPQSVRAKSASIYLALPGDNVRQMAYQAAGLVWSHPGLAAKGIGTYAPAGTMVAIAPLIAIVAALWCAGAATFLKTNRRAAAVMAFPVVFASAYALAGLTGRSLAEWYLVPLIPYVLLGMYGGMHRVARFAGIPSAVVTAVLGCGLLIAQASGLNLTREPNQSPFLPRAVWTPREVLYKEAAEFLNERYRPGEVVAASEIGALGYYCRCIILDTVGLVSPVASTYYPLPSSLYAVNYAVPPDLIRDHEPDYLVTLDVFVRKSLLSTSWFGDRYQVVWSRKTDSFGSRTLDVYVRRDMSRASAPAP